MVNQSGLHERIISIPMFRKTRFERCPICRGVCDVADNCTGVILKRLVGRQIAVKEMTNS